MDVKRLLTTLPGDGSYANLISEAFSLAAPGRLQAAVAYATQSGVAELSRVFGDSAQWHSAQKQWLVGIDYCRSDPQALVSLQDLPRSQVRIHDGAFVVQRPGCTPRISYHPKLYVFTGATGIASVVGSGNLSHTGLRRGVEAAAALWSTDVGALKSVTQWYRGLWNGATPLADVQTAYVDRYLAFANRQNPVPVEDDAAPASAGVRGQLTPIQLRQLRVCQHLWIQAGNLHLNRGPDRPGNQLMLKRNTRVFFGFQAVELAPDTAIGAVAIRYPERRTSRVFTAFQ